MSSVYVQCFYSWTFWSFLSQLLPETMMFSFSDATSLCIVFINLLDIEQVQSKNFV